MTQLKLLKVNKYYDFFLLSALTQYIYKYIYVHTQYAYLLPKLLH